MRPFLTANWRYLSFLNYVVDPAIISPLVPPGTEIDFEEGVTFLSVVGFLFLNAELIGSPLPRCRDFEEVNLRFYVRMKSADTWRRGVVYIRKLIPRGAVPTVAPAFSGESYVALPMKHDIEHVDLKMKAKYAWRRSSKWEHLSINAHGEPQSFPAGSHPEFITQHDWGYASVRAGCREYRVQHSRWKIWKADEFDLRADVSAVFAEQFAETLKTPPHSGFIADGSAIIAERRSG